MNIFDILGPVMVGPSSSHTAGAARIAKVTRAVLADEPVKIKVYFHGSFAETYVGHGSDKAVIGGMLGYDLDDERIRDSLNIAGEKGIDFSFHKIKLSDAHPNTIIIEAQTKEGIKTILQGASVGGGNIIIQKLNGITVDFNGNYDTLVIEHIDTLGAISLVTNFLSFEKINIANMKVFRALKGGRSIMIIETDGNLPTETAKTIESFQNIIAATFVAKIS